MIADKDLLSIQQARILAENARDAQKKLVTFSQAKLDGIAERVAEEILKHAQSLAVMSQEETGCGKWQDKTFKNRFVATRVPERIRSMRCVGIIGRDEASGIMDIGVPMGVIAAVCPVTAPVSTAIYKTLIAIKSGNAIVFAPHPRAAGSMGSALDIMIQAATAAGLPEGALSYMGTVTKSGTLELMKHPAVNLILATSVPTLFKAAQGCGTRIIYGGRGNGPAFIERSADLSQAVKDIVESKTFDNGLAPAAEQSVVIDACILDKVQAAFIAEGAYFMSDDESHRVAELFFHPDGRCKKGPIGLDAQEIAKRAGIAAPAGVRLLMASRKYVLESDPYSRVFLAPVMACFIEADWMHACEKCIELLLHERQAHTLVIHSNDEEVICQFALKKPVARMLVNTPASLGGMGASTNLFPAMTLGSGSAGQGITSDNVSPMNLVYIRRVGFGRQEHGKPENAEFCSTYGASNETTDSNALRALHQILQEALEVINKPSVK